MGMVSQETIAKLNAFIDSLPEEARSKCALCNETLTHIVKQAEAQTGAPTLTVCRTIADDINKVAAPADMVTAEQLRGKVRVKELGRERTVSGHSDQISQKEEHKPADLDRKTEVVVNRETGEVAVDGKKSGLPPEYTNAFFFAKVAVSHLESIPADDPKRFEALDWIIGWCEQRKQQLR